MKIRGFSWIWALALGSSLATAGLAQAEGPTFMLRDVQTPASSYLSTEEIRAVTRAYVGQPITFRDLQIMVGKLQALYTEAGVPTAQVVLPPQDIRDGVLKLGLIEAKIEAVEGVNNKTTHRDFLTSGLTLQVGEKPDYDQIERDLRIFTLAHDIRPLINFRPGEVSGGTIATIDPQEPERLSWGATLDNFGRKDTGRARLGLSLRIASLSGWRDSLQTNLTGTKGSWQGNMVYDRPMGLKGGHAYVGVYATNASVIGGSLSDADVISDGRGAYLGYRFPVKVEHDRSLSASLGLTWDNTKSRLAGVQFADTTLTEVNGALSFQRQQPLMQLAGSVALHFGTARNARSSAGEGGYGLLKVNGSLSRLLTTDLGLNLDLNGQVSPDRDLPIARQFSVGGSSALRGYPSDVRAAPSGVMVRAQLNKLKPIPTGLGDLAISPFAFADAALLVPHRTGMSNIQAEDKLFSLGLGAQMALPRGVGLSATIGVPMRDTTTFKGKGDAQLYVSLSAKF